MTATDPPRNRPVRLPSTKPDRLGAEQLAVYRELADGDRASGPFRLVDADGSLTGPFGPMVLTPSVGAPLGRLGAAIRYRSALSARIREIVVLAGAAYWQSEYEWYAHERVGAAAGLVDTDLAAIRDRDTEHWDALEERTAHRVTLALLQMRGLPAELFTEAGEVLGLTALTEIVVAVGYYATLDLLLSTFEIGLPDGEELITPLVEP